MGTEQGPESGEELIGPFHLRTFEDALTLEEGASPRTLDAYRRDVIRCAVFMRLHGVGNVAGITPGPAHACP